MKYKLGDKLNYNVYLNSCIPLKKLHDEIRLGDKFWKSYLNIISEFEFIEFYNCTWQNGNNIVCRTCKGKIKAKYNGNIINGICTGASEDRSNVLKIIKKEHLPDDLFEI